METLLDNIHKSEFINACKFEIELKRVEYLLPVVRKSDLFISSKKRWVFLAKNGENL